MITISVTVNGVTQSSAVSKETAKILKYSSAVLNRSESHLLRETVKKHGLLSEINLLRFLYWTLEAAGFSEG